MNYLQAALAKMKEPRVDKVEKLQLEEILELCADYERQIEAEQRDALERREKQLQEALSLKMQSPQLVLKATSHSKQLDEEDDNLDYDHHQLYRGGRQQPQNEADERDEAGGGNSALRVAAAAGVSSSHSIPQSSSEVCGGNISTAADSVFANGSSTPISPAYPLTPNR